MDTSGGDRRAHDGRQASRAAARPGAVPVPLGDRRGVAARAAGPAEGAPPDGEGEVGPGDVDGLPGRPEGAHKTTDAATRRRASSSSPPTTSRPWRSIRTPTRSASGPGDDDEHVLVAEGPRLDYYDGESLEERLALAAVGRDGVHDLAAADQVTSSKRSHSSPALAWRNQTRSPTRRPRPPPSSGVWTSPAPSLASSFRPGGQHRARQPVAPRGARGGVAAAQRGRDARRRPAHHRQREERRRARA